MGFLHVVNQCFLCHCDFLPRQVIKLTLAVKAFVRVHGEICTCHKRVKGLHDKYLNSL